jgi:hypothetical protein
MFVTVELFCIHTKPFVRSLWLRRKKTEHNMPIATLKVLASVLQLHGPGATIQSDHQGIDALLNDLRGQNSEEATQVYFRRGGFIRGY